MVALESQMMITLKNMQTFYACIQLLPKLCFSAVFMPLLVMVVVHEVGLYFWSVTGWSILNPSIGRPEAEIRTRELTRHFFECFVEQVILQSTDNTQLSLFFSVTLAEQPAQDWNSWCLPHSPSGSAVFTVTPAGERLVLK